MPDRRQAGGVQPLVIGDAIGDLLLARSAVSRQAAERAPWPCRRARRSTVRRHSGRCGHRPAQPSVSSMPNRVSAAEFRMYSCPPRTRTTGLLGAARSRSSRSGRRCSDSCASCQSLFDTISAPGAAGLRARGDGGEDVGDRSRARQIDAGPSTGSVQMVVHQPGITVWPCRSIRRVLRTGQRTHLTRSCRPPSRDRRRWRWPPFPRTRDRRRERGRCRESCPAPAAAVTADAAVTTPEPGQARAVTRFTPQA